MKRSIYLILSGSAMTLLLAACASTERTQSSVHHAQISLDPPADLTGANPPQFYGGSNMAVDRFSR